MLEKTKSSYIVVASSAILIVAGAAYLEVAKAKPDSLVAVTNTLANVAERLSKVEKALDSLCAAWSAGVALPDRGLSSPIASSQEAAALETGQPNHSFLPDGRIFSKFADIPQHLQEKLLMRNFKDVPEEGSIDLFFVQENGFRAIATDPHLETDELKAVAGVALRMGADVQAAERAFALEAIKNGQYTVFETREEAALFAKSLSKGRVEMVDGHYSAIEFKPLYERADYALKSKTRDDAWSAISTTARKIYGFGDRWE